MHEALLKLGYLRARAVARSLLRGARRPRGLIYLIIGGFVISSWLCSSVLGMVFTPHRGSSPSWLPVAVPLFLLAYTVSSLLQFRSGIVTFTPAEIDFLFPGPFSRRELLLYKLSSRLLGCLFSGVFLSLAFFRQSSSFIGLYIGLVLTLIFVQLLQIAISLLSLVVAERVQSWGRAILLVGMALLLLAAVAQTPAIPNAASEIPEWWKAVSSSLGGRILLVPFEIFAKAIIAPAGYPAGLVWLGIAAAIDGLLLLLVIALDANYLESSMVASHKRYELQQRMKQGRRVAKAPTSRGPSNFPALGWLRGTGPTIWRQATTALRTGRLIYFVGPIAFAVSVGLGLFNGKAAPPVVGTLVAYLLLILIAATRYDFRGDLDNMPWLKTLPVSPLALTVGQLVVPVVLTTLTLFAPLVGLGITVEPARPLLAGMAPFALNVSALILAVENLFFLLFPSRSVAINLGELQSVGRFIVIFACKGLVLGLTGAVAFGLGGVAYLVSGQSLVVAGVVAWLTITAAALAALPAVAWAFTRFDPGLDTPA